MATTTTLDGLDLTKWRKKFIREYVRDSGFAPYMGTSPMDIIHVVNDLQSDGYTIRVPLVKSLKSAGVSGNARLGGNEEALDQYFQDIYWEFYRNAIELSKKEKEKSAVDLMEAQQPLLREWASELIKYQCIDSFHQMNGVKYSAASAAVRNAWTVANADRVLFGASVSNYSATHATALANVDGTTDKLTPELATLAKRLARKARPRIRPFKTGTEGKEFFVMFCHPLPFRDLKNSTTMQAANRDARARDHDKNPIFQDGDLIYDGIIFREIVEFHSPRDPDDTVNTETTLVNAGAGAAVDVAPNFLCGAQAIGMVNKQAATPVFKKEDDYGFFKGVGVEMAHAFEKLTWNNGTGARQDVGMFTVYTAAAADA